MIYFLIEIGIFPSIKIINLYMNDIDNALSDLLDMTIKDRKGSYILKIINNDFKKNGLMNDKYPFYYIKFSNRYYRIYRNDNKQCDFEDCHNFKNKIQFLRKLCLCNKDKLYIIYKQTYQNFCIKLLTRKSTFVRKLYLYHDVDKVNCLI